MSRRMVRESRFYLNTIQNKAADLKPEQATNPLCFYMYKTAFLGWGLGAGDSFSLEFTMQVQQKKNSDSKRKLL